MIKNIMKKNNNKTNKKNYESRTSKDDVIQRVGTVTKILGSMYEVIENDCGIRIIATLNGKMRMNSIKLTIGDVVDVEVSIYDLTKGRITYRHK